MYTYYTTPDTAFILNLDFDIPNDHEARFISYFVDSIAWFWNLIPQPAIFLWDFLPSPFFVLKSDEAIIGSVFLK